MLIFFDESFRTAPSGHKFGALFGIGIPEEKFGTVIADVYSMKYSSFGEEFAKERELKGSTLLKRRNLEPGPHGGAELAFVYDILRYIVRQRFVTFGVVCFDETLGTFRCKDPFKLERTYRIIFERIHGYMSREFPRRFAKVVFDDVDYGSNKNRAESITNYFNRTAVGRGYDSIIRTPFFAVSQAQNVGIQLADLVTTVVALRFGGDNRVLPFWRILKKTIYRYRFGLNTISTLRVFRAQ